MMSDRPVGTAFREGDEVVLAEGTYQGTLGVFVRLLKDVNWADITERNGSMRSHPVVWLAHSTGANLKKSTRMDASEPRRQLEISGLAYTLWQARGCPDGSPGEDWLQAERQCDAETRQAA